MADLQLFTPLADETYVSIRARVDADVNAGIDPHDPAFLDLTEGNPYWDMTQGLVLEAERLWDFCATEVPAASFPVFAWGEYLDLHGDTLNVLRKDAVAATGSLQLTGKPGSLIPTGIQVATVQTDPDADPVAFHSLQSAVLAASPGPTGLTPTVLASGGTLPLGTYHYVVTAVIPNPAFGGPGEPASFETVVSNEVAATTVNAVSRVQLDWLTRTGATAYKVYRGAVEGSETLLVTLGVVLTYIDTGAVVPGAAVPPTNLVEIEANTPGVVGNVSAGSITQLQSVVAGVVSVSNPSSLTGGAEIESDELYRNRILLRYSTPQGAGNQGDYVIWALDYDPIGFVTVEPLWNGAGTVRVIVTDQQNNPVSATVVLGLQLVLDPVPGKGSGLAPIGATVTVATPAVLTVAVASTLTLDAGYTLDGTGGTIAVRSEVERAIGEYVNTLRPGEDVILEHVKARMFAVQGVHDLAGTQLNGAASNVPVGPPGAIQVARLGTVTLA